MNTLVLLSQILQMLTNTLFSNTALTIEDAFLKVFEKTLKICVIPHSVIITMYFWSLNKSQKNIFFLSLLMQLR